ncbi:HAD family hydrolase [Arthrobacter flavus]|uniref:HAD family hydrolase n=1 Tax=Arthrobacter flavus TaxID=95172 RepID=A0ABW4QAQ1_9MICC
MALPGMIALDLDGTLMTPNGISPSVKLAVRALDDAGWVVVLATGRSISTTLPVALELGLAANYLVCSNGAVVAKSQKSEPAGFDIHHRVTFDPTEAVHTLLAENPNVLCAVELKNGYFKTNAEFPLGALGQDHNVVALEQLVEDQTTRVVIHALEMFSQDFLSIAEKLGLNGVPYSVGSNGWLDLTAAGVTKAFALERLRLELGIDASRTVAIGDGFNDIEMFHWAARAVAMGNAPEAVKREADEVTGTIHDDGAAQMIHTLI